jgi:hypothetical protein
VLAGRESGGDEERREALEREKNCKKTERRKREKMQGRMTIRRLRMRKRRKR